MSGELSCLCPRRAGSRWPVEAEVDPDYYRAIGYPVAGPRAIRVDMLDRLIARLRRATIEGTMASDPTIAPVLGCAKDEADAVLLALGWDREEVDGAPLYRRQLQAAQTDRSETRSSSRRCAIPNGRHSQY